MTRMSLLWLLVCGRISSRKKRKGVKKGMNAGTDESHACVCVSSKVHRWAIRHVTSRRHAHTPSIGKVNQSVLRIEVIVYL